MNRIYVRCDPIWCEGKQNEKHDLRIEVRCSLCPLAAEEISNSGVSFWICDRICCPLFSICIRNVTLIYFMTISSRHVAIPPSIVSNELIYLVIFHWFWFSRLILNIYFVESSSSEWMEPSIQQLMVYWAGIYLQKVVKSLNVSSPELLRTLKMQLKFNLFMKWFVTLDVSRDRLHLL